MFSIHDAQVAGKVPIITPTAGLTAIDIQKADLLLASLYDAGQYAERVAMKLDFVATVLRRQFISYDSAVEWLRQLGLLRFVSQEQFRHELLQ